MSHEVIHGDCLEVLPTLADASVDAIVTDPPYALTNRVADVPACDSCGRQCGGSDRVKVGGPCPRCGSVLVSRRTMTGAGFMGKNWDNGLVAFSPEVWREAIRVAKPGAHLLAFGGTRTFHRLACAIEDAGWELRDTIGWLYGSGFPKSHNLDGEWHGWGTALKPAWEPIIVARRPLSGTVAENVLAHGCGAINIDGCRVGMSEADRERSRVPNSALKSGIVDAGRGGHVRNGERFEPASGGRWPANIIHDGSYEVVGVFPDYKSPMHPIVRGKRAADNVYGGQPNAEGTIGVPYGDSGSAARFFYTAKSSKSDRGEGNHHPTVKPTALMRYLCRLVTPPGGTVLDPFCGSGSTGKAASIEGFNFIGIEREAEYVEIARRRIASELDGVLIPVGA